jgi:hypothetical protein
MTPKEKAKELFDKYEYFVRMYNDDTPRLDMQKQCALIAVDEIIEIESMFLSEIKKICDASKFTFESDGSYWAKVKQEIEKL